MKDHVSWDRLRSLLKYDRTTGLFYWRITSGGHVIAGKIAGCSHKGSGYIRIGLDRNYYRAHQLAWFYVHREWPPQGIDHRNSVRDDNRIRNLRLADQSENSQNQRRARSDNKSGYLGVSWDKKAQQYRAQLHLDGKIVHASYHGSDPKKASRAYLRAKAELHPFQTLVPK
jgi:hypothetical protein